MGSKEENTIYGGPYFEVHQGRLLKYVVIGTERIARIGTSSQISYKNTASITSYSFNSSSSNMDPATGLAFLIIIVLVRRRGGKSYARKKLRIPIQVWASGSLVITVAIFSCKDGKDHQINLDYFPEDAIVILKDHLGSWHLLVDAKGKVIQEQAFLPYGIKRYSKGSTSTTYGYTGKQQEPNTGLLHIGPAT